MGTAPSDATPARLTEGNLARALADRESPPEWLEVSTDLALIARRIIDACDPKTLQPVGALYGVVNWRVDDRLPAGGWRLS